MATTQSTLLYKTLLSEVKENNQSTIPVHLQSKVTDRDELVQSVMKMVNGSERRSTKFEKKSFDVSRVRTLTEDIPKKFSVGYWRRWYDDLTLLEDISLKEDAKQSASLSPIKIQANKSRQLGRKYIPPLVPVSGGGGGGQKGAVSDSDRKSIMKFLGLSEKCRIEPKVKKRSVRRKRRDNDDDDDDSDSTTIKDTAVTVNTTAIETSTLSNIKEDDDDSDEDD